MIEYNYSGGNGFMKIIDMHCDTMSKLARKKRKIDETVVQSLYDNDGQISVAGMKKAGTYVQFFANFIHMGEFDLDWERGYAWALKLIQESKQEIHSAGFDVKIITSFKSLGALEENKIGAILTIEEGGILNGKVQRLEELYHRGIRLMTLTWNYENCIGFPNSKNAGLMKQGLKPFGFEVLEEMNRLGMIVDVSHLSDGGFWDVVNHSKSPIVASHSNARALCNVTRNLTDEMIKALGEQGGACGVNFYPCFVKENAKCAAIDLAAHVKYLMEIGGEDLPAIGTDFDGYDTGVSEINHVREMELFLGALYQVGLSTTQVEKVCFKNAERIMKEVENK